MRHKPKAECLLVASDVILKATKAHLSESILDGIRRLGTIAEGRVGINDVAQGNHAVSGVEHQLEGETVRNVRVSPRRSRVCKTGMWQR